MANHFAIDDQLNAEDRTAFLDLARNPATTHAALLQWLVGRGYRVSKSGVGRWKKSFDEQLASVKEAAELAAAYRGAMGNSIEDIQAATLMRHSQKMLAMVMQDEELEPGDAMKISMAIRQNIGSANENIELKKRIKEAAEASEKLETKAKNGGVVTVAELHEVRRAMFGQ